MSESCVVETTLGKVRGCLEAKVDGGKQVYSYLSIPFAKPPVGDLRFELPRKAEAWQGILDGTKHPPRPHQDKDAWEKMAVYIPLEVNPDVDPNNMSEDCLYLSVYTTSPSKAANLPVMFWIYGGGFIMGSQDAYNASILSSLNDVVVVIPNYRVNVFGFFSLGKDTKYPGNMGLYDQIMALKWTKDNIKAFGGNPDNVTIFGESAGSMSVNYHMCSPLSRGLFHRAVSHSGTGCMRGFPSDDLSAELKMFLECLKIEEKEPEKIIKKLKELPANKLLEGHKDMAKQMKFFTVIVDGKIFPENPKKLHDDGKLHSVPYIVGCNNTEHHGIMTLDLPGFNDGVSKDNCKETLKNFLIYLFKMELTDSKVDEIMEEYGKDLDDGDKLKWSRLMGDVLADVFFSFPTMLTVTAQAKHKRPTYLYNMTQTLKCNHDPKYGTLRMRKAPFCECDHGDDLIFTFGVPLSKGKFSQNVKFSEEEKKLAREWMRYLTNFARNGDPNVGQPVQVKWPSYSLDEETYLSVQHPCSVKKKLGANRLKFWREVVESKSK